LAASGIKLILGLGNPGLEYSKTRHNAGFWFLDALSQKLGARLLNESKLHAEVAKVDVAGQRVLLAKPNTFMNRSGLASQALLQFYKIDHTEMLVVHDELDLDVGVARLKFDGGHGGQNGLRDISGQLGHGQYHRLRIGIGHPGQKDLVTPWVLGKASQAQELAINQAINRALDVMALMIEGQTSEATKRLHTQSTEGKR
jgi:peptidyl-tRNA hydrolase, PTH1 family